MTTSTAPKANPVGTAIRTLRKTAGLTNLDASHLAGVSPAYLSRVENGLVSPTPSWISTFVESVGKHLATA